MVRITYKPRKQFERITVEKLIKQLEQYNQNAIIVFKKSDSFRCEEYRCEPHYIYDFDVKLINNSIVDDGSLKLFMNNENIENILMFEL